MSKSAASNRFLRKNRGRATRPHFPPLPPHMALDSPAASVALVVWRYRPRTSVSQLWALLHRFSTFGPTPEMRRIAKELKEPVSTVFTPLADEVQREWRFYTWASRNPKAVWAAFAAAWREERLTDSQAADIMKLALHLVRRNSRPDNRRGYCILDYDAAKRLCKAIGIEDPIELRPDWIPPAPTEPIYYVCAPPLANSPEAQLMSRARHSRDA